ncbi:MAG: hypothetical protein B7Y39_14710 [Bdellovibrio sp. 28-41-41]|nr:MAG: hypothetical protein B7Y39_14710 [Bdellovibrio sp. 28-41-41]
MIFLLLTSILVLNGCYSDPFTVKTSKLNDKELVEHSTELGTHYFYSLSERLKRAVKSKDCPKMQSLAGELLAVAPYYSSNWNYGNAIFDGHMAYASCDVKEKKLESAFHHLAEAAKTPGSPQLSTFGPPYHNMSVLSDLLREGRKAEVVAFLNSLKRFWDLEFSQEYFDVWDKEIEAGRIPKFEPGERASAQGGPATATPQPATPQPATQEKKKAN